MDWLVPAPYTICRLLEHLCGKRILPFGIICQLRKGKKSLVWPTAMNTGCLSLPPCKKKECKPAKFWHLVWFNLKRALVLVEIGWFKAHLPRLASNTYRYLTQNSPQSVENQYEQQLFWWNSPEKWLHNWIATYPNKSKKLTRLTSPSHTTHGKVRINPLEIWVVMQRVSKQRSSRCDHANSGPVVRFNGWTQLCV